MKENANRTKERLLQTRWRRAMRPTRRSVMEEKSMRPATAATKENTQSPIGSGTSIAWIGWRATLAGVDMALGPQHAGHLLEEAGLRRFARLHEPLAELREPLAIHQPARAGNICFSSSSAWCSTRSFRTLAFAANGALAGSARVMSGSTRSTTWCSSIDS